MMVNWRNIPASANTYAVLSAACELSGYALYRVRAPAPDVTCYSLNSLSVATFMPEIAGATCITIVGGPHASACYPEMAEIADYVVVGEGEYTLPLLLDYIRNGSCGKIPPGVATSGGYTPVSSIVRLDAYPPFSRVNGYVEISRGCPFSCAYCQTPRLAGSRMRHRSVEEIVRFASRYRHARFVSPNALAYGSKDGIHPDLDRVEHLLRSLDKRTRVYFGTFPSEVRPEFITDRAIDLITTYCDNTRVHFGAQSGSDAMLRRLRRGHTVADVIAAVETCTDRGILPVVDFIVGLPDETDDEQRDTLKLAEWIAGRGKIHIHQFVPLPGTPLSGTRARHLLPEAAVTFGKLSLAGRLTGSWSNWHLKRI
jgi:B12-binding domain/radical SAM domain protein